MPQIKKMQSISRLPSTWITLVLSVSAPLVLMEIFKPAFLVSLSLFTAAAVLYSLWLVMCLKDPALSSYTSLDSIRALKKILKTGSPDFRAPAEKSLALIRKISVSFPDDTYTGELDLMLQNIHFLAESNAELYRRTGSFGTEDQKESMNRLLARQVNSINNTYEILQRFSGNLTLMDANVNEQALNQNLELKLINQGLQDTIREIQND